MSLGRVLHFRVIVSIPIIENTICRSVMIYLHNLYSVVLPSQGNHLTRQTEIRLLLWEWCQDYLPIYSKLRIRAHKVVYDMKSHMGQ